LFSWKMNSKFWKIRVGSTLRARYISSLDEIPPPRSTGRPSDASRTPPRHQSRAPGGGRLPGAASVLLLRCAFCTGPAGLRRPDAFKPSYAMRSDDAGKD
jgi:hypothetical protein